MLTIQRQTGDCSVLYKSELVRTIPTTLSTHNTVFNIPSADGQQAFVDSSHPLDPTAVWLRKPQTKRLPFLVHQRLSFIYYLIHVHQDMTKNKILSPDGPNSSSTRLSNPGERPHTHRRCRQCAAYYLRKPPNRTPATLKLLTNRITSKGRRVLNALHVSCIVFEQCAEWSESRFGSRCHPQSQGGV
jgi:hypothetical protein